MWNFGYNEETIWNLRDSVPGIVKRQSKSGLYIDLNIENNFDDCKEIIPAFGYWTGKLPIGTKVLCSIKRPAKENKDMLVSVDSVIYESGMEVAA